MPCQYKGWWKRASLLLAPIAQEWSWNRLGKGGECWGVREGSCTGTDPFRWRWLGSHPRSMAQGSQGGCPGSQVTGEHPEKEEKAVLIWQLHKLLIGNLASSLSFKNKSMPTTKRAVLLSECKNISFHPKCLASCEKSVDQRSHIIFKSEKRM